MDFPCNPKQDLITSVRWFCFDILVNNNVKYYYRDSLLVGDKRYLENNVNLPSKRAKQSSAGTQLLEWLACYFAKSSATTSQQFVPPVYLQHDGHSRSVVGMIYFNLHLTPSFPFCY